jgi:hypothetical protein
MNKTGSVGNVPIAREFRSSSFRKFESFGVSDLRTSERGNFVTSDLASFGRAASR